MVYCALHNHSDYSNLRGLDSTNSLERLLLISVEKGIKGVALTDHESLGGHLKWLKLAEKYKKEGKIPEDFKAILGNEIYLCRDGLNAKNYVKGEDGFWHFILIAKDNEGHHLLRQLSSTAWQRSFRQFIERVPTYYSDIEKFVGSSKGHLIASTACIGGYFPKLLLKGEEGKALNFCLWCKEYFGDDFYIELQPGTQPDQIKFNKLAVDFAEKNGFKVIITTDAHYPTKKDRPIHKAFLTSNESEREVDTFYESTYIMDCEEIVSRMDYIPQEKIEQYFRNTLEIYDKIEGYNLTRTQVIPKVPIDWGKVKIEPEEIPGYEYINKFIESDYEEDRYYVSLILQGALEKKIYDEPHLKRIDLELEQIWKISEMQGQRLSTYFLTVQKVIDLIWEAGSIVGDGRGSVATHVCSYCINIIQYDPLESPIELPYWRFLSDERPEYPDIDIDFEASKREKVIETFKSYFQSIGGDLIPVATFGTTTSKSALQSAARGLGYDAEIGTYLSSIVPIDRGFVRSLSQCYYGDEEKGYNPLPQFIKEMRQYPDIWEVAQGIEGLINRRGRHACGVLPVNSDFTDYNAIMKAPDGGLVSQWELHDSEDMGGMKFDALTTDFLDRIHTCMNLLIEYGHMEWQGDLRSTYNYYLYPSKIHYDDPKMWDLAIENKVSSLFQFDTPVGLQTIKLIKPHSLGELAQANSLMRLMPEGKDETPSEEYVKYKNNMELFNEEIEHLHSTEKEKAALHEILDPLYGVADGQEAAMRLLMHPDLFGFSIKEGHGARKLIAKKKIKEITAYGENLFKIGQEKGLSYDTIHYIWDVQIGRQLGYSFSYPHTISYSIIAIQALNLAYYYPIIYWNTACLIVDSDGLQEEDDDEVATIVPDDIDDDDDDDDEEEVGTKKKAAKAIRYDKISAAIGKMIEAGIKVVPPDINHSNFSFTPDEENDEIIYGLRGITRINADIANDIINNRPYESFEDVIAKVKLQKLHVINLIKSGALDGFGKREELMETYLHEIAGEKKKLTLQNLPTLISRDLIPQEYDFEKKLFNFNKFLKKNKDGDYYYLDSYSREFFESNWDISNLDKIEGDAAWISQKTWDKIYKKNIENIRPFINSEAVLNSLNNSLYQEVKEKYALGTISTWEMDSIGFYYHEHELNSLKMPRIDNFFELPEEPIIQSSFVTKDGKVIYNYELSRIAGTVIGKDKLKNIVTLLTQYGVVKVKVYRSQFAKYDKQVADRDEESGKKHILERSWFQRGNKLIMSVIRRGDFAIPKVYKSTPYPVIQLIDNINYDTGTFITKDDRLSV